jgi:D-alanyl-D-alanine carboxypeptidase
MSYSGTGSGWGTYLNQVLLIHYGKYGRQMVRDWDQVLRTHFIKVPLDITRTIIAAIFILATFSYLPANAGSKYAGIVMDAKTGKVLYSHKANDIRYPASLTKMMTLYLMFEALEQGKITKKTRIRMSKYAASKPPSKLGIKPGRTLSAEQAIYALVTKSANDVATAVAEHLGDSERNFANRMTNRAKQLGMRRTKFRNASGLTAKGQVTTAKDMALLGIALREHYPKYYRYFSTRSFKYGKRKYGNHNRLLGRVKGVDGIKTGYTNLSGFNLVSSVQLNKRSIVAVVLGGKSGKSRNAQMQKLIARHLKKATRRPKRKSLIAKINAPRSSNAFSNTQLAGAVISPERVPIPVPRQQYSDPVRARIEQAHLAKIAYPTREVGMSENGQDSIRSKLLEIGNSQTQVPQQNPVVNSRATVTANVVPQIGLVSAELNSTKSRLPTPSVPKPEPAAPLVTGSIKSQGRPGGWHVQIAAVPDQSKALSLLSNVRKKMPALKNSRKFGNLRDYLEPVVKNGQILYRARFAGFHNKYTARSACKAMKKRKISCLAIKG